MYVLARIGIRSAKEMTSCCGVHGVSGGIDDGSGGIGDDGSGGIDDG